MRFVDRAERVPNRCAFFPQHGPDHPQGFVAADGLVDDHFSTYVSVVALREIAQKFPQVGLARRDELTLAHAELEAVKRENEDLREQMAEYDRELDAIHVLKGRGYSAQKKPGRKPQPAAKAA